MHEMYEQIFVQLVHRTAGVHKHETAANTKWKSNGSQRNALSTVHGGQQIVRSRRVF